MKLRKLLAALLVLASLASLCAMASAADVREYTDYKRDDWFFRYVEKATDAGWMNGTGEGQFNPNGTLNRAMFVTILHRMMGTPAPTKAAGFSDVVKGAWYENAVNWAAENGVVTGYADGRFGITDPLTREQMATILFRFAKAQGKDVSGRGDISAFTDKGSISSYATDAFAWAVDAGIITGSNNTLTPKGTSTRAQAATVLVRFDAAEEAKTLTRADLEEAIVMTGWAYSHKDTKIQYDSVELSLPILSKYYGGNCRLSIDAEPEFGTAHTTIMSVCSDYCQKTYYNTLNERIYGYDLDWVTANMWNYSNNQFGEKLCLIRYGNEKTIGNSWKLGMQDPDMVDILQVREWLKNWKENMRPGDLILSDHTMLYIGDGWVLDCYGGKYSLETGLDLYEPTGAVDRLQTVEGMFFDKSSKRYIGEDGSYEMTHCAILRPLNALCIEDGDNDPGNDKVEPGTSLTESAKSRLQYPGMEIDRTVNITPYGTAVSGETLTYTVAVSNRSNEKKFVTFYGTDAPKTYTGLKVTEKVPAGTEFLSAAEGGKLENGTITWNVDLAPGETKNLTYTVKVTAKPGSFIVSDGGFVDKIPSNSITNKVGASALTEADLKAMDSFYACYGLDWMQTYGLTVTDDTSIAEEFYSKVLGKTVAIPTVQQLMDGIFEQKHVDVERGTGYHYERSKEAWMYTPKADAYEKNPMLVYRYMAGVSTWFETDRNRINEFSTAFVQPGDLLFYVTLSEYPNSSAPRTVTGTRILMWLGNDRYAVYDVNSGALTQGEGEGELWKAFTYDVFFMLRPAQAEALAESGKQVAAVDPVQAEAESRQKFPGIEVERTASCGLFGSPITGEDVTYTVTVKNGGTADYKALPILENVPTGTEFKSAEGTENKGGKLQWTVDVPAGKSVSVTYTVKVTAKGGDLMEATGKADNIPTATTANRIGKDFLTADRKGRLEKLSAMTGEQMLSELALAEKRGLDQIRILYSWLYTGKAAANGTVSNGIRGVGDTKNYYQNGGKNEQGLYIWNTTGSQPALIATQVDGAWGGSAMDTTGSLATKETFKAGDLTPGDLLVQSDDKALNYCLYLGAEKFVCISTGSPNGTAPAITGAETVESCFSDGVAFFTLLRPSFFLVK